METAAALPQHTPVTLNLRADGMQLKALGRVRVVHPSRGMGIELAAETSAKTAEIEKFIQFLMSRPGIAPEGSLGICSAQGTEDCGSADGSLEDPLLNLLRNHESFSENRFSWRLCEVSGGRSLSSSRGVVGRSSVVVGRADPATVSISLRMQ